MISRPLQIVLGITVLLTLYANWKDSQPEDPPARRQRTAVTSEAKTTSSSPAIASAASSVAVNLFPQQTWQPPPPKPTPSPKPTPTPAPVAPPLPFQVVSTWHDSSSDYAVLEANGQQIVVCQSCNVLGRVQKGEVLLGTWRVDQFTRQHIVLTFLPLNQQQVLSLGATP